MEVNTCCSSFLKYHIFFVHFLHSVLLSQAILFSGQEHMLCGEKSQCTVISSLDSKKTHFLLFTRQHTEKLLLINIIIILKYLTKKGNCIFPNGKNVIICGKRCIFVTCTMALIKFTWSPIFYLL